MTTSPIFVGVDVAKETLDVGLRPSGEGWSVTNEEAGVAALVARRRSLSPALVRQPTKPPRLLSSTRIPATDSDRPRSWVMNTVR